jgi:DNA-binding NarL/FixJ family response regulator
MPIPTTRTRVLLVDDEVVVRAGLRLLIDSWPTLQVIGEADTPSDALVAMADVKPNLIVCSYGEGTGAFLADLRVIVKRADEVPVVVLASSRHPHAGTTALQAGVNCVISKKRTAVELRQLLEQLCVRRNGASKSKAANHTSIVNPGDSERRIKARS